MERDPLVVWFCQSHSVVGMELLRHLESFRLGLWSAFHPSLVLLIMEWIPLCNVVLPVPCPVVGYGVVETLRLILIESVVSITYAFGTAYYGLKINHCLVQFYQF